MIPKYLDIVDLIKKGATVEAQEKIMELRESALELQEENIALKAKIKELENALDVIQHLEYTGHVYWRWLENEAGDYLDKDGPFCQVCNDTNNMLVRLYDSADGWWKCKHCKNTYLKVKES